MEKNLQDLLADLDNQVHSDIKSVYRAYPGWRHLLDRLIDAAGPNDLVHLSCKEKWGGLSFGMAWPAGLDELIEEIEDESFETCEVCGRAAHQAHSRFGWRRTVCNRHDDGT